MPILLFAVLIVASCNQSKAPIRPEPVPEETEWVSGSDGGFWIACGMSAKEPVAVFKCTVFAHPTGDIEAKGEWLMAVATSPESEDQNRFELLEGPFQRLDYHWFDGEVIGLGGSRRLVPDGPIDFPFPDGGGNRVTFVRGKRTGEAAEY